MQGAFERADDAEHDLFGAASDADQPAIAVGLRDGVVGRETHASPVPQAGVGHLPAWPPCLQLGHAGQSRHVLPGHVLRYGVVGQGAQHLHLSAQFGQAEVHHLVVEDALAEGIALAGVLDGLVDQPVQGAQGADGGIQALFLEL